MGQIKNIIIIIAGISILAFVGDQFWTKYSLDTTAPTCTNNDVESTLIELITRDLKNSYLKEGVILNTKIIK